MSYIYIIKEKVQIPESIYKIGVTDELNPFDTLKQYQNRFKLLLLRNITNHIH
jgi:hypothetical protein